MPTIDVMNRKLPDMINDDRDHDTFDTDNHAIITIIRQHTKESNVEQNIKLKEDNDDNQEIRKKKELERNTVIIQRWWRQRQLVLHTLLIYGMDKVWMIILFYIIAIYFHTCHYKHCRIILLHYHLGETRPYIGCYTIT